MLWPWQDGTSGLLPQHLEQEKTLEMIRGMPAMGVQLGMFAAVSGHSPDQVESAVAADLVYAGGEVLPHAQDAVGLLMDAHAHDKDVYCAFVN